MTNPITLAHGVVAAEAAEAEVEEVVVVVGLVVMEVLVDLAVPVVTEVEDRLPLLGLPVLPVPLLHPALQMVEAILGGLSHLVPLAHQAHLILLGPRSSGDSVSV